MIQIKEALDILRSSNQIPNETIISLKNSLGHVLSKDILAPIDLPGFNQSAMDGYAVCLKEGVESYEIIGEVEAGSPDEPKLSPGQCVRIFTGAKVPVTANTVVQQEWAIVDGNRIQFDRDIQLGKNIRPQGEQIKSGNIALAKGHLINAASIGFLAGLGLTEVAVFMNPKIQILTTGNELIPPGNPLKAGQIYESNSAMLEAALRSFNYNQVDIATVPDNYEQTVALVKNALESYDFLILSGGISVGDYDFVHQALVDNKVEQLFYKVNQKPGKPLFFGQKENKIIAALPGNPAAALTCFYVYVLPMLNKLSGKGFEELETGKAKMSNAYIKKGDRAYLLKAKLKDGEIQPLDGQSSAMLQSFALSNAIIHIPSNKSSVEAGEDVEFYHIPR
ncbi:MAG: gephyrin-like molybdotransferase Glp [Crocinitomicaceae bacterium]